TTKWLVAGGLATASTILICCVGSDPKVGSYDDDSGTDGATTDGPVIVDDAGSDASTDLGPCAPDGKTIVCDGTGRCFVQVEGAGQTFCARDSKCDLYCWGDNTEGQLGQDPASLPSSAVPKKIDLGGKLVTGVTVGGDTSTPSRGFVCARATDTIGTPSSLYCWGSNVEGQLGVADAGGQRDVEGGPISYVPHAVATETDVASISASVAHVCAASSTGAVSCWGYNLRGELGHTSASEVAPDPVTLTTFKALNAASLGTGSRNSCFVTAGSKPEVLCFGDDQAGQLGTGVGSGAGSNTNIVTRSPNLDAGPTAIATAVTTSCVLETGGKIECFGANLQGQCGDGTGVETVGAPKPPVGLGALTVTGLVAGEQNFCANVAPTALADGGFTPNLYCWGLNDKGQTFQPQSGNVLQPTLLTNLPPMKIAHLALANQASCAIMGDGSIWCWGANSFGELAPASGGSSDGAVKPPTRIVSF
ncbi:MAG TPA: hypothetical protein VF407_05500, partial [Polyangiaceae bacterium]